MGDEGTRGGSAGDGVHHGSFDFDIAASVKKLAQFANNEGASLENLPGFLIGHEIEVALAIAQLNIRETMPFFGKREKGFGERKQLFDPHGELAGFGTEDMPADAEVIAQIQ